MSHRHNFLDLCFFARLLPPPTHARRRDSHTPFDSLSIPYPIHGIGSFSYAACKSFSILITEPAAEAPSCACWSVAALRREGWRARNKPRPGPPRQARSSRPVRCCRASVVPLGRFGGPVHADAGTAGRVIRVQSFTAFANAAGLPWSAVQILRFSYAAACEYRGFLPFSVHMWGVYF